ncbi:ribose-phosphate diphosphokinase [Emticicia sp. C21]|uniref:ribose-phosphate diphosphokinase n=1 Tax=Emticicia sp. C21 TaxID=2302915 RepID=UPI000E343D5D|nr:ribose-phosphate diphosphokinase [Emticicia sp. C21]RFS15701.1 ribose-phosphate pyrophosphokinase [Emticicia sp. C21]
MKTINLDKNFNSFLELESISFEAFTFAGGEPHIKIKSDFAITEQVVISHRLNSFNDLGLLCVAVDALKRMKVKEINAFIPYFPAARQDRVMVGGEPLTVKVYADIINALQLSKVTVFDPHSEVTPALLNNCEVIPNHTFIKKAIEHIGETPLLISPDGGALKKIYKVSEYLGGVEVVECSKSRDVKTGKLSGFKVYADDLQGRDCMIVDDICDGGATFIGLAEELKKKNAGKLYLAISHGIFSKGFANLTQHFEKIFTTDSVKNVAEAGVVQINLGDILDK